MLVNAPPAIINTPKKMANASPAQINAMNAMAKVNVLNAKTISMLVLIRRPAPLAQLHATDAVPQMALALNARPAIF